MTPGIGGLKEEQKQMELGSLVGFGVAFLQELESEMHQFGPANHFVLAMLE